MKASLLLCACLATATSAFVVMLSGRPRRPLVKTKRVWKAQRDDGHVETNTRETRQQVDQDDGDKVARQTTGFLHSNSPRDLLARDESDRSDQENNDEDDDEDFDPNKQIFDPLSFWTERSGRFPRRK